MEELLKRLSISEETIKQMVEICPNIEELSSEEIVEKIEVLKEIKCNENQIRNIISSNAMYLDKSIVDIQELIKKLIEKGFTTLNILFDSNPYILNLDAYEIETYIDKREKRGEKLEDIVDDLESNVYLFEEI